MKKILSFVILITALSSCSEDIKFNNEAVFQGVKDNLFWRGSDAKATRNGSVLTISSSTLIETMAIQVPVPTTPIDPKNNATYVTYPLGTSLTRTASYSFTNDLGEEFFYETAIGVGDGEVVISEFDGVYVSGTFRFNAVNTDPDSEAAETVNLQNGTFYKIPVVNEL
jgi:hypothetical protein